MGFRPSRPLFKNSKFICFFYGFPKDVGPAGRWVNKRGRSCLSLHQQPLRPHLNPAPSDKYCRSIKLEERKYWFTGCHLHRLTTIYCSSQFLVTEKWGDICRNVHWALSSMTPLGLPQSEIVWSCIKIRKEY